MDADRLFAPTDRGASVSADGLHRYDLQRRWDDGPLLGFIMCNPSTADADVDDPTIRRCISFARREGMAGIVVRNLWTFRATKPTDLRDQIKEDPAVAVGNADEWLADLGLAASRFTIPKVVAAWGALAFLDARKYHEHRAERLRTVSALFAEAPQRLVRFSTPVNNAYTPHPLYLAADTPLVPYEPAVGR